MQVTSHSVFTSHGPAIESILENYFLQSIVKSATIDRHYKTLWEQTHRLIRSGGKRFRPHMVALAYEAFGGSDTEKILPIAVAHELLHVSMLIHDDIIDRDYVRYGVDNVAGSFLKEYAAVVPDDNERLHYAHSAAILAGDLLISASYQIIATSKVDPVKILQAQQLLGECIFEVAGGELLDTESSFRGLGAIPAETVARYKTASYSFIGPLLTGAMLANASESDQKCIRSFAENIGIAYQLVDDALGIFGDASQTGKTTDGDIREGKNTYMVEQFYASATDHQRDEFVKYFGKKDITPQEADKFRDLLRTSGAFEANTETIESYVTKARKALTALTIDDEHKRTLENLIAVATRRTK